MWVGVFSRRLPLGKVRVEECVFLENFCGFSGKMEDLIFVFPNNPKEERLDLEYRTGLQSLIFSFFFWECFSSGSGDGGESANVHLVLRLGSFFFDQHGWEVRFRYSISHRRD